MSMTIAQLTQRYGGTIVGDAGRIIMGIASLDSAGPSQLTFVANPKYLSQASSTRAAAILISQPNLDKLQAEHGLTDAEPRPTFVIIQNPYAYFARIAQQFAAATLPASEIGIHPFAVVAPTAKIASSATIGPYVTIESNAVIGARVHIDAHVFIGHSATIGDDSRLYPNVTVYHGCYLSERVTVHSGAVIGADGFGFAPDFAGEGDEQTGEWVKIPQVGAVTIGPDVEIGANTTIDRGVMADTLIEQGVKIDNLVQIGHNCRIGAYTVVSGCTGIAGSTTIGRYCMIGGAVGIAGHITLADRVVVTAKSGVSKSLLKSGIYTSAFPAMPRGDWNKSAAILRNIDKLRERIKTIEAALDACYASRGDTGEPP
ncbi:UDP-3-O-(3-hydroxymyristoyl)glucosamine N-acyltransferase [Candidatus Vallotia cooleyia]|uniref:UDP-3-O-(3-hydroxymyristoyl)glucosamine N-acyltransferase n=1 Tax=Candidatus Vallotiella adelgis TaxID=1177211 RepID=UPI001D0059D9|nr:UDP-3-O-(3-hydroxymyristoyl)glucosamine N-acyltransferase [Candidatus Vallotia cooleyia]UDG81897.1 UDP-3-O-acylglucosamine N-acyltransferase [Candidatus Vallotia cooleyia]